MKVGHEGKDVPSCPESRLTEGRELWKNGLLLVQQMASIPRYTS